MNDRNAEENRNTDDKQAFADRNTFSTENPSADIGVDLNPKDIRILWETQTGQSQHERAQRKQEHEDYLVQHTGITNLYQELHMSSRFVDAQRDINRTDGYVQLHSHSFIEIIYCLTGDLDYLLGTRRYRIRQGDVIIIPPGVSHRPIMNVAAGEDYYDRIALWVNGDLINYCREHDPRQDWSLYLAKTVSDGNTTHVQGGEVVTIRDDATDRILHYFESICRESDQEEAGWETVTAGNTVALMSLLQREWSRQSASRTEQADLLDSVIHYVENHLAHRITLEETARHFLMSESSLSKLFRTRIGTSFYQFVTQRRLIAAKSLLEKGVPPTEIAEQIGFGDYSSFYRAFRKAFGISPGQYMDLLHSQDTPV